MSKLQDWLNSPESAQQPYAAKILQTVVDDNEALLSALTDATEVIKAARCIRHWHDHEPDGMVVSAEHVRLLWAAIDKYDQEQAQ